MTGKVKVIKKDDIQSVKAPKVRSTPTKREVAREMVSTVSTWVSDFRVKKSLDTRAAFEELFASPRPSES